MVAACITTLGLNIANGKILANECFDKLCKPGTKFDRMSSFAINRGHATPQNVCAGKTERNEIKNLLGVNKIGDDADLFLGTPLDPGGHIELGSPKN